MGPTGCSETSETNYHYSLRNNPGERRWDRQVVPKRRKEITTTRCIITQGSGDGTDRSRNVRKKLPLLAA
jgi:hypothetical protein